MSQRNPMNDRYQNDIPGQTKKSAASLKPKSKAAASVYVKPTTKTRQEKKAIAREQRAKRSELDRLYYNPPTPEYKRLRRIWFALLAGAIVFTVLAMTVGNMYAAEDDSIMWAFLFPAYACIIAAIWLDMSKVRKVRREYQLEMLKKNPKKAKNYAVTNAANKKAAMKEAEREEKKATKRFGHTFGKKKAEETAEAEVKESEPAEPTAEEIAEAQAEADAKKPIAQLKKEREEAKKH